MAGTRSGKGVKSLGNVILYLLEGVGFHLRLSGLVQDGRQAGSQVSTVKGWAGQREVLQVGCCKFYLAQLCFSSGGFSLVLGDHSH